MSAATGRLRVLRRAQRLLPAGLQATGLLPPTAADRWEASPLAGLRFDAAPRYGLLGLRMRPLVAAPAPAAAAPGRPGFGPWRALAHEGGLYWTQAGDGRLAVLLDVRQALAWLLWQDEEARAWSWH